MDRFGAAIEGILALGFVLFVCWGWRSYFKQEREAVVRGWRDHFGIAGLALSTASLVLMVAFYAWAAAIGSIGRVTLLLLLFLYGGSLSAVLGLLSSSFGRGRTRAIGIVTSLVMAFAWWLHLVIGGVALVGR